MCSLRVESDFSGGNIVFERIEDNRVLVHQDLRDTNRDWFYWQFRVRGAEGQRLEFRFTTSRAIGTRGPAVSRDDGITWSWFGAESVIAGENGFVYQFGPDEDSLRFCFCIPYLQGHLDRWLTSLAEGSSPRRGVLCQSRQGRDVELLRLGREGAGRIALTARHHCCESMANFVIEGLIEAALEDEWLMNEFELVVIPFVDKDGVENGDQGKGRAPRDHGRDYAGESIYPECAAIRELLAGKGAPPLLAGIDLHCPYISGNHNEHIYVVGGEGEDVWRAQQEFSRVLGECQRGPLVYDPSGSLPFGQGWNKAQNYADGKGFRRWASDVTGIRLSTSFEIPYANHGEVTMTPENTRAFGRDLAKALSILANSW